MQFHVASIAPRSRRGQRNSLVDGGFEQRRCKQRGLRDDRLVERNLVTVAFADLRADQWIAQVELAQLLQLAEVYAQCALVHFPDQFRAIDAGVGPLEIQIVCPAFERMRAGWPCSDLTATSGK